jgi:metallo-beta-lactamase family protein
LGDLVHLEFHGAARSVTGSRHLLAVNGHRVLLDCGLFQGHREESDRLNREFGFAPGAIDAVVMSHAHIDHSGALPALVKKGFRGAIHGTLATADLLSVMLRDSASIQEKDVEFVNKNRQHGEELREPLYVMEDADRTLEHVHGHPYHEPIPIVPGLTATYYDAGHLLGSAIVVLGIEETGRKKTLIFSGDLGRKNVPILRDPEVPSESPDALIIESTYGDRVHAPIEQMEDKLADLVNRVMARKGKVIVPSFAVGRTQELVFTLARLLRAGRIPGCAVYVDSPLAVDVTEVFRRHPEAYDAEIRKILEETGDPFGFRLIQYVHSVEESKALNDLAGPFIVISASGMAEQGRILHHLRNGIEDPRNVVLIVGYQAANTLGRRLAEGAPEVRIFGETFERKAEVVVMHEFSAHADRVELLQWVERFPRKPERAFAVHGEESQSLAFAAYLREAGIPQAEAPTLGERVDL